MRRVMVGLVMSCVLWALPVAAQQAPAKTQELRTPDVIYVPTPQAVVDAMLKMANVTGKDIVYDLGCGDGRIPITAARENAKTAGVIDKVTFLNQDLFTSDIKEATVVTLYLLPSLNEKLMPKLKAELKPGTRVVSHAFDMGDWKPEKELDVNGRKV